MRVDHMRLHRRVKDGLNERDVKTVYVTASATFKGKVGGYLTLSKPQPTKEPGNEHGHGGDGVKNDVSPPEQTDNAKQPPNKDEDEPSKKEAGAKSTKSAAQITQPSKEKSAATTLKVDTNSVPTAIRNPDTNSVTGDKVLAKATGNPSLTATDDSVLSSIPTTSAAAVSSSTASAVPATDNGTSAGAKAGIAFGVLGGLFVIGMLVFFLFSRRRKQMERQRLEEEDEKFHAQVDAFVGKPATPQAPTSAPSNSNTKAPRVSLRPVTQFNPNFNGLDKRSSKGAAMALAVPSGAAGGDNTTNRSPGGSAWERPSNGQDIDPSNPFGVQAERIPTPIMEESEQVSVFAPSPVTMKSSVTRPVSPLSTASIPAIETPVLAEAVAVTAVTTVAAAALTRKASMRKDGPKPLDLTLPPSTPLAPVPPSPAGTEFSISSMSPGAPEPPSNGAAAIAAAGGPVNSSVHRVQLDFKPTLDDELELRAGDLVRLLHEYDDGWALCIRLDRSRQGVVPRTCLSTRPVKPRPQGAPRPGPPVNSNGGRPASPAGRSQSPMGRPMTPNGARPQSPMGNGSRSQSPGPRSQSPNGTHRRNPSPPGPSPMNPNHTSPQGPPSGPVGRKPVPGQAL
ncbi:hypothetical protein BGZ63DRAFT_402537 [Mariannaea sp. PMI_226]|nr:hypothetical protein BGZ63DRAFT_402537 [Mariannaea sp. PMI_226]